ncbi:ribonuclease R [Stratiformator vulcanicus]|uniref:Ribonuclease R n=1 Tax=Stratiformator vulcanicus TaxID=2527980 RepID=A0A517R5J0_9PLAN|nr:ribonuclease R [Stratiformator vulcanicus]QDT39154.1 Ribonuclease R [Stratiformator vulcanicus]
MERRIVELLHSPGYKPVKPAAIARKLGLTKKHGGEFRTALANLMHAGTVVEDRKGRLRRMSEPGQFVGIYKKTRKGGFVTERAEPGGDSNHEPREAFIPPEDSLDAADRDEVSVEVRNRRGSFGKRYGRIVEVLQRARHNFVGTYLEKSGKGFVRVDGNAFDMLVEVGDPGAKGARQEDKVVIEMLRFPRHERRGEAVLVEVLGKAGEPGVDTQTIIHEYGLPTEFSTEVLEDASEQADRFDETDLNGRVDLTKETIVTIDPVDARDFDDAISLRRSKDGHWHLGVHIADVSTFVQPNSALDRSAKQRGTSVYLPGRVIPMLPEVISNGLASLQQGKVRYTKSALMEFNAEGIPVGMRYENTAIKVTRRFAYEEVMPIVNEPDKYKATVSAKIRKLLVEMYDLAMLLRQRRFAAGAIELFLPEVKLVLDRDSQVEGAEEIPHDPSHQIIEEFMLAANVAIATEMHDKGIPLIRRAHPEPDEKKLKDFAEFVGTLDYRLKQYQSREALQELLQQVKGEPQERAVNYAMLRSLKQAVYTAKEEGHYALAFEHYCHFTSPIRRYADLVVHRTINELLTQGKYRGSGPRELERIATHCSDMSRRAEAAERDLVKLKLLQFMQTRVGQTFHAVITGVERFGFFARGIEIPFEGMAHISAVEDALGEIVDYDSSAFALVARRSGRTFRLGEPIEIEVTLVDVATRKLDLKPLKASAGERPKKRKQKEQTDSPPKHEKKGPRNKNPKRNRKSKRRGRK